MVVRVDAGQSQCQGSALFVIAIAISFQGLFQLFSNSTLLLTVGGRRNYTKKGSALFLRENRGQILPVSAVLGARAERGRQFPREEEPIGFDRPYLAGNRHKHA